ncbi:MAG: hypothetical protein ACK4IT_07810 [Thioalkalivibrionaceae bacterium]
MRRRRIDEGLVLIGVLLLVTGGYLLFGGDLVMHRIAPQGGGVGGVVAQAFGAVLTVAGVYFLFQSRR